MMEKPYITKDPFEKPSRGIIVKERELTSEDLEKELPRRPTTFRIDWLISQKRSHLPRWIRQIVGPESNNAPGGGVVLSSIFGMLLLLVIACIAVAFPCRAAFVASAVSASFVFICVIGLAINDLRTIKQSKWLYRRNLGNTLLTITLAIPFMTFLYAFLWYPQLNRTISRFSQDIVDEIQYPAVALFQKVDWTSQATIRPKSMKCALGWLKENAVDCETLPADQIKPGQFCNCKSGWNNDTIEGFDWQGTTYRYLSWRPTPKLIDRVPTYLLVLQAFFTYNASQSLHDSSATQSPSLWLAIYDPRLSLIDALTMGYTRMMLIPANGNNAINLGLVYRQSTNHPPAYDYDLSLSSNQNLDLVCDTSPGKYKHPCHVTLLIKFPTFDRKIILQQPMMRWSEVAASAGAFWSFVQFVSWILSGQATAT